MAPATTEKVIFAEDAATVHILDGDVVEFPDGSKFEPTYSKVLNPGETLELSVVPSYLREAVLKGEAPGLTLLTPTQAKRLVNRAEKSKASLADLANMIDDE